MNLVADNLQMKTSKQKMSKDEIIRLLSSTANLMEEQEDLTEFIGGLDWSRGISVEKLNTDFQAFKDDKNDKIIAKIAHSNGLQTADLKAFVVDIMSRLIFDGEKLTDLLEPLELNWKERSVKEQALMTELINKVLIKQAQGREISGLSAYE
jgi:type I restriction enzyme R subunit